jgi:exosortase
MRLISAHFGMEVPDMVTFVPSLAGAVLLAGGWRLFIWAGPIVAFLVFMFPLPWRVSQALLVPLQKVATICSTYLLQVMGYGAYREANVIHLAGVPMEVIDACSGLRMLTVFLALCAAVAMVIERPLWERLVVFASAVPIALAVNVMRITATGMAHYHIGGPWVSEVFHDHAGYVMMPLAMILLYFEIMVLGKILIDVEDHPAATVAPVRTQKQGSGSRGKKDPVRYHPAPVRR